MTDRPILFSGPMVRALIEGRKTMTRRLAWTRCIACDGTGIVAHADDDHMCRRCKGAGDLPKPWQRVQPGDRLWVKESFSAPADFDQVRPAEIHPATRFAYRADGGEPLSLLGWRNSYHCPRIASRLLLTVTETRRERLQDITEEDAIAEGSYRLGFQFLWNSLHGEGAWQANPEVVALTYAVERRNIDAKVAA